MTRTRRDFLKLAAAAPLAGTLPAFGAAAPAADTATPRITFYGATRQVSGSCHLLETADGLYVIDCGLFMSDVPDQAAANKELPFDPKEVKAVFLTHAHADHHGRLPLMYKNGFRGPVYCTDATRDLTDIALGGSPLESDEDRLFEQRDATGLLRQLKAIPYNRKFEVDKLTVRYTDAGHILGSAMVEIWADGKKLLFSGDMGPDTAPILCRPTQHFTADAVLVESTYGPAPRPTLNYEEFGKQVAEVIERGGSVLMPSFAIHKAQLLIYMLHRLVADGIVPKDVPIYCDSSTAQKATTIYDAYPEYFDHEAREFAKKVGTLFYRGKYREARPNESMKVHDGKAPAIFISTSGMITHAAAPKHLVRMAENPKNAVFIPGYQAPNTVGRQLLDGAKRITVTIEEIADGKVTAEKKDVNVKLTVGKVGGFSSHAVGEQILEWVSKFERVGPVYVVHGDEKQSTGMAEKLSEMGVESVAPKKNETFTVKGERVKPGPMPKLGADVAPPPPAAVDK